MISYFLTPLLCFINVLASMHAYIFIGEDELNDKAKKVIESVIMLAKFMMKWALQFTIAWRILKFMMHLVMIPCFKYVFILLYGTNFTCIMVPRGMFRKTNFVSCCIHVADLRTVPRFSI